jgi:hypothetical protein
LYNDNEDNLTFHIGYAYVVTVRTGDVTAASTDAEVYIKLYGTNAKENSGKIILKSNDPSLQPYLFDRANADNFTLQTNKQLSPLSQVEIGHDNSGWASGWFLESVTVS